MYGGAAERPTPETAPLIPRSPYAVTKLTGEHYCRVFTELHGLETVALRYFNVYGPRQRPDSMYAAVIPLFIDALRNGHRPTVHGDGQQSRDFTFIDDVVAANLAAARAPADACSGEAYNIACGREHSLLALLDHLGEILDVKVVPEFTDPRPGDVRHSCADTTAAARDLGWKATVAFRDGLTRPSTRRIASTSGRTQVQVVGRLPGPRDAAGNLVGMADDRALDDGNDAERHDDDRTGMEHLESASAATRAGDELNLRLDHLAVRVEGMAGLVESLIDRVEHSVGSRVAPATAEELADIAARMVRLIEVRLETHSERLEQVMATTTRGTESGATGGGADLGLIDDHIAMIGRAIIDVKQSIQQLEYSRRPRYKRRQSSTHFNRRFEETNSRQATDVEHIRRDMHRFNEALIEMQATMAELPERVALQQPVGRLDASILQQLEARLTETSEGLTQKVDDLLAARVQRFEALSQAMMTLVGDPVDSLSSKPRNSCEPRKQRRMPCTASSSFHRDPEPVGRDDHLPLRQVGGRRALCAVAPGARQAPTG